MLPNIMIVQPPSTASGNVASAVPTAGTNPAMIIMIAPIKIVKRFTTFVMATRPTFWLKDVIGIQPNRPDNALINPSQAIEPLISFSVTSLPNPDAATADVSPIVSVADTKKIIVTDTIALILNSGLNGIKCGTDMIPQSANPEKSTFPIGMATRYPTTRPARTDNCL